MASFHGLRQKEGRPAGAGGASLALSAGRSLAALAALTAAFIAATQLAGSGASAPAPELPSFLADALGAPQPEAPLVREPAPGVEIAIAPSGYRVNRGKASLSVSAEEHGRGEWRRFAHGVSRPTSFGRETITVEPGKTEQYLTVEHRQGVRTWRWTIEAGKLTPRITPAGAIDFLARDRVVAGFRILPAAIYDGGGKNITPEGVRWSLRPDGAAWSLRLRLDDSKLPLPYVIDPATISLREKASGTTGTGGTSLTIAKPTGVVANDFLIAQITARGGTGVAISPPDASWTLLDREDSTTVLAQAVYYKVAGASEPLTYSWTLTPSQRASGGIIAYYGVDNGSAIDTWSVNTGTSATTVTATGITTSAANHGVVGFFGIQKNGNFTVPGGMAEEYDMSSSSTQSMGADYTAPQGATGDKTATIANAGGSQPWLAHLVSLTLDITPPTTSVAVSESPASADQHASGSTLFYRPGGLGGAFTVDSGAADGTPTQSGLNKVTFPGLSSGFAPPTSLDVTASPYSRGYTWLRGATLSGAQTLTAVDEATNSTPDTFTVTPDSAAPSTTDNTGAIGSSWKNANQTVGLSPGDGSGSGIATTYYETDGSTPDTSSPQGTSISLTTDGLYTIKYFSVDNVSNSEPVQTAGTQIRIDKTLPTSSTLDPLPSEIRNGQALTGSATDGGPSGIASLDYYYCAGPPCTPSVLIGSSSSGPSYSVTWNSQPADGDYEVLARASDNAGNTLDSARRTVTIDNTNPNTTIDTSPPDPSNNSGPSFTFSSNEAGATFECELDSGGFTSCSSPKTYSGLSAGSHTFRVRATDAAGNVDPTPASYTWTIDLTDPNTTITASPSDPSNDADPSFSFISSETGSTFACKLDAGAFAACTSPTSYTGLAAGSHTFEVKATDAAGNADPTPASHTWTIDLTDPQTTIDSSPADPTNATGASFDFSSSETGSTFQCRLDGASFSSCTSPRSYWGLAAGSHTFEVRAMDAAGNTDSTPASHTWTIDLTDPNTTITSAPSDPSNNEDPSFSFTSSEARSSFECKLDAGAFAVCTSPQIYTGLGGGSHTFEVKASDAAGNTDTTPASLTWTIDLSAPSVDIDSAPSDPSPDTTPMFEFSASETGSTFECELDGSGFFPCTSPAAYGPLGDGNHSFGVRATDPAGNSSPPATYSWLLNSGSPTVSITAPTAVVNAADADPFNVTATTPDGDVTSVGFFRCDNASVDCATGSWILLANDPSAPYSAPWPVDADGNRALRAVVTDVGSNTGADVVNVTIDRTLPVTTIGSGPADPSTSPNVTFGFSAEAGASFACRLDGGSFAPCTSPHTYTGLGDGAHVFEVRATDAAGNVEAVQATYGWTIDTAAPQTTITVNPSDPTSSGSADFEFTSSEAGSTFLCELDGAGFSACTSPLGYTGLADGGHTFKVKAADPAGNQDPSPSTFTWLVDATDPNGGLSDPGSPLRASVMLTATPSDDGAGIQEVEFQYSPANAGSWTAIAVDGTAPFTIPWDTTATGDGLFDLRVVITDNALNSTPSAEVEDRLVDNTDPSVTMADPGAYLRGTVALSASANDGPSGSGIASVAYQRSPANVGTWTTIPQNWDTTAAADGLHDLRVLVTDNAGNSATSAPVEDRMVDNTKPGLSSSTPADGSTVDFAASVSVTGSEALAGIAGATIDGAAAPPPVVSGATVTYTFAFVVGPHTLAGELEDAAGNRTPIRVHFTVLSAADAAGMTDLPYTEKNSYASASTSLAASYGGAEVTVPLGAWTGAAAGDWLVVRIDPRPMVGTLASGFQADGDILDVTAYWALAETEVHDFAKALDVRVPNAAANALPAVLEGSAWRVLVQVTGTQLPSTEQDGFYRVGTDVHILTRNLSSFALLRDVEAPSKPKNFRGANSSGRLVLRWDAATDNSGLIGSYAVYANGVKIKTLAESARSVDLGRFKTTDARKFQLRAYDAAGNASKLTYKLAIVPAVKNLTLTDAKARLVKRGLKAGTIKRAYSSSVASGRVISAGKSGLVPAGTGVSLTVSLGSANRTATSAGTGTSTGSTGTGGTSAPTSGFTPQATPAPSASTGGAPQPPAASESDSGEGELITSLESTSQSESYGLRNALGIALLVAAFLVAFAAIWRSRRRHQEEASVAAVEPVLFWDTRLLQLATGAARRLAGRA